MKHREYEQLYPIDIPGWSLGPLVFHVRVNPDDVADMNVWDWLEIQRIAKMEVNDG